METELRRTATVAAECDVSRRTVYRRMRDDPDFPEPIRLGAKLLFRRTELDSYLERKRQARPTMETLHV